MLVLQLCDRFFIYLLADDKVLELLAIADEFVVEKLTGKCEGFLLSKSRRSALELLKIGSKYRLKSLVEFALVRVSRMPGLVQQMDKADLGLEIQNRILRLVIERYKSSRIRCCMHVCGDVDCCYEKSKLNSMNFDSSDSSDDEDSVCYLDYVKSEDFACRKKGFDLSDTDE